MKSISRRILKLGAPLALLGLSALLFWPIVAEGTAGEPGEAAKCRKAVYQLARSVARGEPARAELREEEINAHLAWILSKNASARSSQGLTFGIRDLKVDLTAEKATFVIVGELARLPVTFELSFVDEDDSGDGALRRHSVRVGHLPLVWPIEGLIAGRLEEMFRQLHAERRVLGAMNEVELGEGRAVVSVGA